MHDIEIVETTNITLLSPLTAAGHWWIARHYGDQPDLTYAGTSLVVDDRIHPLKSIEHHIHYHGLRFRRCCLD